MALKTTRARFAVVACMVLSAMGCSRPATAIVVVVESDMTVPSELSSVHVEVGGAACSDASCAHDFGLARSADIPFSFTVTPTGDGGPLALVVRGRDPSSTDRVVRSVETSFITGRTLLLHVRLERACLDASVCSDGSTCIAGTCASDHQDASLLHDVVPGTELSFDAGVTSDGAMDAGLDAFAIDARDASPSDTSPSDTSPSDTSPSDTNVDAPSMPRTCADLPSGTASGPTTIDPDGVGGAPAFVAYCETSADGGGWTLIAKADPSTDAMGFGQPQWTAPAADAHIGSPDLTVGNALLEGYWTMAVRDIRIVMAPAATPTDTRTLLASFGRSVVLRDTQEPAGHVRMTVTSSNWQALVGARAALTGTLCEETASPAVMPVSAPVVRVRIGEVWSNTADCAPAFWAGIGADGMGCHPVADVSGGGRLCGTGAQREALPRAVWVFAR